MPLPKIFRYSLNQKLRRAVNRIMRWVTTESNEEPLDLHKEQIKKILLVRATFRMGHSILAIPAILLFRKTFPQMPGLILSERRYPPSFSGIFRSIIIFLSPAAIPAPHGTTLSFSDN